MAQSALPLPPLNGAPPRDRAIVATLLYYDLFAYPLQAEELVRFAHHDLAPHDLPKQGEWWDSGSANLGSSNRGSTNPDSTNTFWYLRGRESYIQRRVHLTRVSSEKLERARKFARLLQLVPGVRFIGVTGSLAMESAVPEDDIDFLVIAARGRLWLTRALVLSALLAWGVKRPDDGRTEYPNLICANIFLSEDDCHIPDENLFIAHEICQMLPLLGKASYRAFLDANRWVKQFLPQWKPVEAPMQDRTSWRKAQHIFELAFANGMGARVDRELAYRQLHRIEAKHARGHNPGVKITPTQLRFHARDLSDYVVNTFNARWQELQKE